jgi:predicted RNA-binding Zn ribbon-like protein
VEPDPTRDQTPDWDWLGEALAVDFANTTKRSGETDRELLQARDDLVFWADLEAGRVPAIEPEVVRLGEIRTFRDDVKALLHAAVDGERAPVPAVERVNARLRAAPLVTQLRDGAAVLVPAAETAPLDELLARVAQSAIELAAHGGVGFCDAPSCGQFFERSRATQLWCSHACGTRARVARHAQRRKA